jgi:hypothetical protein
MRARDATRLRFPLALKKLACVAAVGFKPLIYINQQKQKKKKKNNTVRAHHIQNAAMKSFPAPRVIICTTTSSRLKKQIKRLIETDTTEPASRLARVAKLDEKSGRDS